MYDILCPCGRALKGSRQQGHQVLLCPGCGRSHFILPRSAFAEQENPVAAPPRRWWRAPLIASVVCLALALVAVVLLQIWLPRSREQLSSQSSEPDLHAQIATGRELARQGKFRLARQALDRAVKLRDVDPEVLTPTEHRDLNQTHRQADLLGRLLPVPLQEVVRRARLSRDADEWALLFEDYRGKAVVFDDAVGRDEGGMSVLARHVVKVGDEPVRVILDDLDVLRDLPLPPVSVARKETKSARMVFGARLAACEREKGGEWTIRFVPDSGVLFTDLDVWTAGVPWVPDLDTLKEVFARQQRWLDDRVPQTAAKP